MSVRSLGHLAQAEIQAFGEQDVEQAYVVLARCAGSQVSESLREADLRIDLDEDVRYSGRRQTAIKVEDEFLGFIRDSGAEPIDPKFTVLDASVGDRAVTGGGSEPLQALFQSPRSIFKPGLRIAWQG
jgi:hypothetical protein